MNDATDNRRHVMLVRTEIGPAPVDTHAKLVDMVKVNPGSALGTVDALLNHIRVLADVLHSIAENSTDRDTAAFAREIAANSERVIALSEANMAALARLDEARKGPAPYHKATGR